MGHHRPRAGGQPRGGLLRAALVRFPCKGKADESQLESGASLLSPALLALALIGFGALSGWNAGMRDALLWAPFALAALLYLLTGFPYS
jgi:hypothetical protein